MKNAVKIIQVSDVKQDKNGRNYKLLRIQTPSKVETVDETTGEIGIVRVRPQRTTITAYQQSYLDDAPDYLWDAEAGEQIRGGIERREVEPYEFFNKEGELVEATTASVFVEGIPSDAGYETMVARAFERKGHILAADTVIEESFEEHYGIEEKQEEEKPAEKKEEPSEEEIKDGKFPVFAEGEEEEDVEDQF